jgi:hypothetical protein
VGGRAAGYSRANWLDSHPLPSPQGGGEEYVASSSPSLTPMGVGASEGTEGEIGDAVLLAVVGAHLSGMPLNHELRAHGARFVAATATAPDYRLYALPGATPPKPGLLRTAAGQGSAIAVEVWAMPPEPFGRFAAAAPPPLSIGSVRLADGCWVKGFLVEAEAVNGARDISSFGGWRGFVAKAASQPASGLRSSVTPVKRASPPPVDRVGVCGTAVPVAGQVIFGYLSLRRHLLAS